MPSRSRKRNGARWRAIEAQVLATEQTCALCGEWVLRHLDRTRDPRAAVIDHDIPVSRGGPEYDRANLHLMHRSCNRWKDRMTLAEARAALAGAASSSAIVCSPGW